MTKKLYSSVEEIEENILEEKGFTRKYTEQVRNALCNYEGSLDGTGDDMVKETYEIEEVMSRLSKSASKLRNMDHERNVAIFGAEQLLPRPSDRLSMTNDFIHEEAEAEEEEEEEEYFGSDQHLQDQMAGIRKEFEEYNKLNGTDIFSIATIMEEGSKVGREIADKVLNDYPNFPEGVEVDEDFLETATDKDMFIAYCIAQSFEIKQPKEIKHTPHGTTSSFYGGPFETSVKKVWDEYAANKLNNLSM